MSKTITVISIIVLILILGVGGYYLLRGKYGYIAPNQPSDNSGQQNSTSTDNNNQETQTITIQNFAFNPASVTIKVGTTVKWINEDSATHTIKSNTFNSPNLNTGGTFEFKFTSAGTYDYICGIHTSMKGKIIVEQ